MKKIFVLFLLIFLPGCVSNETAVSEARKIFPQCTNFQTVKHRYSNKHSRYSRTKIKMQCPEGAAVKIIKCNFGFGIISDTTCWENN